MSTNLELKSSRASWLGAVPSHWKVTALKRVLAEPLKYGATEPGIETDLDAPRYIRITDFNNDGELRNDTFVSLPDEIACDYYLTEGDVLFARSGATVGKTFLFNNYHGKACFAGYLIKASSARHLLSPEFLCYFTKSLAYDSWKDSIFTQATIQNIGADKYAYLPICTPPLKEQKPIVTYLDASCAAIDAAVAAKRQQLETLDALQKAVVQQAVTKGLNQADLIEHSIQRYGATPKHWKKTKLRYEISIQNGDFASDKVQEDGPYAIYGGNGIMGRIDITNVEGETVVIGRVGAYCGNAQYVQGKVWVSDNALIVKSRHNSRFLTHLFNVLNFNAQANTTAQPVITGTKIKNTYVVLPPLSEQAEICQFIERENKQLEALRTNLQTQISTLLAYRKSLIHECVTGQRRITEDDIKHLSMTTN